MMEQQPREYSRDRDGWSARHVSRGGKELLLFSLIGGMVGMGLLGLVLVCLVLGL
jgi:hypothetical protein